jgi:transcription antitermination factor NusG
MGQNWFIVATNPQGERKAAGELRRAGLRVYIPKRQIETTHARTKAPAVKRRPVLIGYLFVRVPAEMMDSRRVPHFARARACQGVKDFVRVINANDEWEPWPIPDRVVAALMVRNRRHEFDDDKLQAWWKAEQKARFAKLVTPGARVLVKDGPFATFEAIVIGLTTSNAVKANVQIFGRDTQVTFENPRDQLEPVERESKGLDPEREAA